MLSDHLNHQRLREKRSVAERIVAHNMQFMIYIFSGWAPYYSGTVPSLCSKYFCNFDINCRQILFVCGDDDNILHLENFACIADISCCTNHCDFHV